MAWKILSALAAVCLAGSAFFAWKNTEALKNERDREAYTTQNLEKIIAHKGKADEAKTKHTAEVEEAGKELETTKAAVVDAATKAQEKEQELAAVKTQLEGITKVVNDLQKQIDEAGDIKALLAQIATLKKEREEAESKLTNQIQRLASAQEVVANLNKTVAAAEEREARGRKGIVEPDFTATVSRSFPEWGFVLLDKGNGGGVFANANLEVKRGEEVVAKLRVRNVEQNSCVADLVVGSVAEGTRIRPGDRVVAAAEQSQKPRPAPTKAAAQPEAAAAAAAPAMGGDPFGAPAGGMAPAPASDPFGAAPAPAGGMAPAPASDPFGAAPAPAAGTPAAPSTADPFGAAPPAAP